MSVPIGWPDQFATEALDGSEGVAVIRDGYETIVTTTGTIAAGTSATIGVQTATNVAGTVDGAGRCAAYTCDVAIAITAGMVLLFTPHADSAAPTITLTPSVGGVPQTARSIRTSAGTQPLEGMFKSGVQYFLTYQTNNTWRVIGERVSQTAWTSLNLRRGTSFTIAYRDDEDTAYDQVEIQALATGRVLISVGDGTAAAELALEVQADKDVRTYGRFLSAYGDEVYHPDNQQVIDFDDVGEVAESVMGPAHETAVAGLVSADVAPLPTTGADLNRQGFVNLNNAWRDLEPMPIHKAFETVVASSQTAKFYTGGTNFVGRTSNVVETTGPSVVKAWKLGSQQSLMIEALSGSVSDVASPTIPVAARTWIGAGQSWMARAIYTGLAGAFETYTALNDAGGAHGLYTRVIDCAVGASALLYGAATDPTNYWWDQINDLPGPNAEAARDAIIAWDAANPTQPFPEAMLWCYGLNDLSVFAATGDNTPAIWTASQIALQDWLDDELTTALGTPITLNHFISPLPARKLGVFDEEKWYAMRRAQLDVVATDARTYRLADSYDLLRMWNDEHHNFAMQKRWGARWPWFIENALHAGTNYEGPEITGFTEVDSSTYWVRITRGEVSPGVAASLQRPSAPAGFGLLPSGSSYIATAVDIARYSWTTDAGDDILVITPRTAASGLRLAYPYGSSWEMQQPSRIIRDLRTFLPLKSYHPSV